MKIKATEKFQKLGSEDNYQHLNTEVYFALRRREVVEMEKIPQHLIDGKYIEIIKPPKMKEK